jgi:hypothetical protein
MILGTYGCAEADPGGPGGRGIRCVALQGVSEWVQGLHCCLFSVLFLHRVCYDRVRLMVRVRLR